MSIRACAILLILLVLGGPAARAQQPTGPAAPAEDAIESDAGEQATLPERVETRHVLALDDRELVYRAVAGTLPVEDDRDLPAADMFYVAYLTDEAEPAARPVTFLVNGGPGAASVFLHLGTAGPKRLMLEPDGTPGRPPVGLEDNSLSWLTFSDLVFIDPVGTGYSRARAGARQPDERRGNGDAGDESGRGGQAYWRLDRDLESLRTFVRLWLTRFERWPSPKVVAGESYGGFRAAALAGGLADDPGVALNGVILVSPALEFAFLRGAERWNLLPWVGLLPSYAATAAWHGKGTLARKRQPNAAFEVERFATGDFLSGLAQADLLPDGPKQAFYGRIATLIGLPGDLVARWRGRVPVSVFAKELLIGSKLLIGRYDGTITGPDPHPERTSYTAGDPSFDFVVSAYTPAFLGYLHDELGYATDQRYEALSGEVSRSWRFAEGEGGQGFAGISDDLRGDLITSRGLHALIVHGRHDMVTPYFVSAYLVAQMALPGQIRARVRLATYDGGHMFYLRDTSQRAFVEELKAFYASLTGEG